MRCILLVDDNPDDRLIIVHELRQSFPDVEIKIAIDAQELSHALSAGGFDLVITDYRLCWTNGLAVLDAVKVTYPDCPVIMFTDSGNEEIAVEGMKSGLSDYVLKSRQRYRLTIAIRESLEKKRLRQQYAQAVDQLSLSEERLRLALMAASMGALDWNLLTGEMVWSEHHERLFGLEIGSFAGTYDAFLACVYPDDRETVEGAIAAACEHRTDYHCEFRVIWPGHDTRWIASRGKFFGNETGQTTRMIGVMWDITERKQIETERLRLLELERAARTAAETNNQIKDEFLATLSHELRSPLSAILGWSKLLRTTQFNETTLTRAIETIERNAQLQTQLIEDLLDVSRIIQGKLKLNVVPVNLITPVEAAIETVRLAADAKSITLRLNPGEGETDTLTNNTTSLATTLTYSVALPFAPVADQLTVLGDPNRLQQIVWNLLSNAIKFTPDGGNVDIYLTLTEDEVASTPDHNAISPASQTPYAEIKVIDTGKGIDPGFLPYVFDSFRQADASTTRDQGGLGLGLAIVRHLVELHGGSVKAESPGKGQGAIFTVRLPLVKNREEKPWVVVKPTQPNPAMVSQSLPLQGLHILVIDDERDSLDFLAFALREQGAQVDAVASVGSALEVIYRSPPDLLVSDIAMPEEDGYSLLEKVKSLRLTLKKPMPAIALTAYARSEDRQRAIAAGFQEHLAKPIEPDVLIATVANLAAQRSLQT
jgi:signal transduction histidine kinase/DNA-binding response OmpR family regulator